jgi:hypothetical protein
MMMVVVMTMMMMIMMMMMIKKKKIEEEEEEEDDEEEDGAYDDAPSPHLHIINCARRTITTTMRHTPTLEWLRKRCFNRRKRGWPSHGAKACASSCPTSNEQRFSGDSVRHVKHSVKIQPRISQELVRLHRAQGMVSNRAASGGVSRADKSRKHRFDTDSALSEDSVKIQSNCTSLRGLRSARMVSNRRPAVVSAGPTNRESQDAVMIR